MGWTGSGWRPTVEHWVVCGTDSSQSDDALFDICKTVEDNSCIVVDNSLIDGKLLTFGSEMALIEMSTKVSDSSLIVADNSSTEGSSDGSLTVSIVVRSFCSSNFYPLLQSGLHQNRLTWLGHKLEVAVLNGLKGGESSLPEK